MLGARFQVVEFEPRYAEVFVRLNTDWISTYFRLEPSDVEVFDDPKAHILGRGGQILIAVDEEGTGVGCCAIVPSSEPGRWEFAKLAVDPKQRGKGIGRLLGEAAVATARVAGAERLFLEGNTRLKASIGLYRSLGFRELPAVRGEHERCDIVMELQL